MAPRQRASVKDVAEQAGVSLGTVSNVLNRPDRVSPRTRARVEAAIRSLGFVRNESARALRAGSSSTVAYVMLDSGNPFFTDVAHGIAGECDALGLSLYLCDSDQDPQKERSYLRRLREQRVQGLLVTPVNSDDPFLEELSAGGLPVVLVDRAAGTSLCSVAVDDVAGGRIAVEHLLDLGHERIAFVGGPAAIGQVRERLEGARAAVREYAGSRAHGAQAGEARIVEVTTDALTVSQGLAAGARIADMPASRRPTAAFCANDLLALGLLQQCVSAGVRVPEDLAIVGYDDILFAAAAAVPLTSVRQPRRELGAKAAQLLLAEVGATDHVHEHVEFRPELIARASTLGWR